MKLVLGHLYPDLMNLYGDRGNFIALQKRCEWRGIDVDLRRVTVGDDVNFADFDIVFVGGGQDREQEIVWSDLGRHRDDLARAVEDDVVVLAVCGGYQLLGHYYLTPGGRKIAGLGILDLHTESHSSRLVGNVVCRSEYLPAPGTLVGFENHGGRTHLGPGVAPLARMIKGHGNNGRDGTEGAVYRNVFGTYLHGSLLPKNPHFADVLIARALQRHHPGAELEPLGDALEWRAHRAAAALAGVRG